MTDELFILNNLKNGLKPETELTVSEWADTHRVLSNISSAEPGKWRTSRFPFLKKIMDCLSTSSPYERIIVMKGAQLGFTECGNNWMGYVIDHSPGPMLAMISTESIAKHNSKTRLDPLIEESENLRSKIKEPRSRDSGNTTLLKEFPGGFIAMVGSNAPGPMRSKPIKYLFLDEVDSYPGDVGGEGDPVSLAMARTRAFPNRKLFMPSTPTIKGKSRIDKEFNITDKNYYFVPCPKCNFMQILKFENIKWENRDPKTTYYQCCNCSNKIYNHEKNWMLPRGEWKPTDESLNKRTIGFHISSLYSPVGFYSWEEIVNDFLESDKDQSKLKTFINTVLGETWEESGDAPEWEKLYARREDYQTGVIPERAALLVAGADVQKDRIEIEIVAYGENKISWSIDYMVIMGDTSGTEIWTRLDDVLSRDYLHESGARIRIAGFAIDSGYKTAQVYEWVRKYDKTRVFATKGVESQKTFISGPRILDIRPDNGKRIARGARLWTLGVKEIKKELYDWLKLESPDNYGYCHFPEYTEEYFKQLTAEILIPRSRKDGAVYYEWKKIRERNEALDCRVYARAAASLIGIDRMNNIHWQNLRENLGLNNKNNIPEITNINKNVRRIHSKGIRL